MSSLRLPFPIMPSATGEPSHYAKYGVGGLHYVGTANNLTEISESLKEPGMLVFVRDTYDIYTWTGTQWVALGYIRRDLIESDLRNLIDWGEFE